MTEEKKFDPSDLLIKLKGRDYMEVKNRLVWLRHDHPDADVMTSIIEHTMGECAVFRAEVRVPNGGSATGWGSETVTDFRDYLEKAETKAIGRALAALGYGTQFCEDHEFTDTSSATPRVVDSPVERRPSPPKPPTPPLTERIQAPQPNGAVAVAPPPAQGRTRGGPNNLTDTQRKAIFAIGNRKGLNVEEIAESRYGPGATVGTLTHEEAADMIKSLNAA